MEDVPAFLYVDHILMADIKLTADDDVAQVNDADAPVENGTVPLRQRRSDRFFLRPQRLQFVLRPAPQILKVAPQPNSCNSFI